LTKRLAQLSAPNFGLNGTKNVNFDVSFLAKGITLLQNSSRTLTWA